MRVGEKETSEQAEIVRRYADLFSREQLDALREAEDGAAGDERERLYRLRKTCEGGLIASELVEREDELENRMLAARVTFKGEEMPLRNAQAKLAVLPDYADREELGEIQAAGERRVQRRPARADRGRRGARGRALRASPARSSATRRRRASRCASSPRVLKRRERRRRPTRSSRCATAGSSGCSAPTAPEMPSSYHIVVHAPALAARVDLHEGARDRGLPRDADASSASTSRRRRTSSSTSTTARRRRRAPA